MRSRRAAAGGCRRTTRAASRRRSRRCSRWPTHTSSVTAASAVNHCIAVWSTAAAPSIPVDHNVLRCRSSQRLPFIAESPVPDAFSPLGEAQRLTWIAFGKATTDSDGCIHPSRSGHKSTVVLCRRFLPRGGGNERTCNLKTAHFGLGTTPSATRQPLYSD